MECDTQHNHTQHNNIRYCYAECRFCCVANKPIMLSIFMLSIVATSTYVFCLIPQHTLVFLSSKGKKQGVYSQHFVFFVTYESTH
jgi:hypothetical protein